MNHLSSQQSSHHSLLDLRMRHERAISGAQPWPAVWNIFASHPWVEARLCQNARRLFMRNPSARHLVDDVRQEAILVLANSIRKRPSLGFDEKCGDYGAFLRNILFRCCQTAWRKIRYQNHDALGPSNHPRVDPQDEMDLGFDLAQAIERLDDESRSVVVQFCRGCSVKQIASREKRSNRTIYRRLEKGIKQLRKHLIDPAPT